MECANPKLVRANFGSRTDPSIRGSLSVDQHARSVPAMFGCHSKIPGSVRDRTSLTSKVVEPKRKKAQGPSLTPHHHIIMFY
ncbi:hypothetical protein PABG_12321 [Paracoccidioides brasiliensis Pb03]|nr:hypothetical protein PABG_12321 [Paracoccidioides brasiliensis Pb03]ODH53776.1 hypothetical protein GX48_00194 [Paracoccidioides brasiliensis]